MPFSPSFPSLARLPRIHFGQLSDYSVWAENGWRVKYRTSGPHSSFMALLPTQPAVYLHVNLIIWALACGLPKQLEFPVLWRQHGSAFWCKKCLSTTAHTHTHAVQTKVSTLFNPTLSEVKPSFLKIAVLKLSLEHFGGGSPWIVSYK